MLNDQETRCRICGFDLLEPPWGPDGTTPSYEYCPCCNVEFGYQDATVVGARRYRYGWIEAGAEWGRTGDRPQGWDLAEQLEKIPREFR